MDDKKYQVFVSSTYIDLIDARKKIIETVLSLYHFPVGMEMFSADDSEQWEIIRETIDASDYYVIIIGHKYGSTSVSGISYTEMEYDYAKSLNIPVLAFIRNRDVSTKQNEREGDLSKAKELERFIEKAKANKMCDFWESIDDLATKVAIALPKIMRRHQRIGWVRGDMSNSKEVSEALAELTRENKQLREQVRKYEVQLEGDKPVLNLSMLDSDISLAFSPLIEKQAYVNRIKRDDVPDEYVEFIDDEVVKNYNSKIPSNFSVNKYNEDLLKYTNNLNNAKQFHPILINSGRRFASDVYIEITFPDFIDVISELNEREYAVKPVLNIPKSPIEILNGMKSSRAFFKQALTKYYREYDNELYTRSILSKGHSNSYPKILSGRHSNVNCWIEHYESKVVLRVGKLLQSLQVEFDPIVIVPNGVGVGTIDIKIICTELNEPIFLTKNIIAS